MHCAANIRNFSQKFAVRCKFLPFLGIFCSALHFPYFYEKFRNKVFNPSITHHDLSLKSILTYSYTDTLIA